MTLANGEQRGPPAPPADVDAICDLFESAWLAGQAPRIEDFLPASVDRELLLRELLLAEWDLCWRHKQDPELPTYLERFAQSTQFIVELWNEWHASQSECSGDGMAAALAAPPSQGTGTVIDRYTLLEKLGEGGFGSVWAAEQREPVKRRVALKVIKPGMDTQQVIARFEAERQALALMDHANIAKVLDAGTTQTGSPYFVMELVHGIPITDYCEQERLTTHDRLNLFMKVCHAIQHAHQKGIIHRDIKPSNILVTLDDGAPVPKVIDFGIAKAIQQKLTDKTIHTQLTQFIGTPAYMSPEQVEMSGLDIDTRSDVYSLGVLLYELLTGATPFDAKELVRSGPDEMRKIIREREPLKPSSRLTQERQMRSTGSDRSFDFRPRSAIDRDLDWIVMKCLEKDRTRRYGTANSLAEDLSRHLNDEPIIARPPSAAYRLQKAWRRNRLVYTAGVVVSVALVFGLGASLRQTLRLRHYLAQQYLHKGQMLCESGDVATGLHWIARGLREAPPSSSTLRRDIRETLFAWAEQLNAPLAVLDFDRRHDFLIASPDGTRAATADRSDHTVRIWSIFTGVPLLEVVHQGDPPQDLAFSPDGKFLASAGGSTARIWLVETGREAAPPLEHDTTVRDIEFSADGARLMTLSDPNTVRIWSTANWTTVGVRTVFGSQDRLLALSPDGAKFATSGVDGAVQLWNTETGNRFHLLRGHTEQVITAAFDPTTSRLLTGSVDHTARLWSIETGEQLAVLQHKNFVAAVSFSPDGKCVVTGSGDHAVCTWSAENGELLGSPMRHQTSVLRASFSPDGNRILTGAWDQSALWLSETSGQGGSFVIQDQPLINAFFSRDGRTIVISEASRVVVWATPLAAANVRTLGRENQPAVAFSPDGRFAITGNNKGLIQFWSAKTAEPIPCNIRHGTSGIWAVACSPDGSILATADTTPNARLWSISTGQPLDAILTHRDMVRAVSFSPDNKLVATGSFDHTARIWSVANGKPIGAAYEHDGIVEDVAFSTDGQRLLTASSDGAARVWLLATGKLAFPPLRHSGAVLAATFSPDGTLIATGGRDRRLRFWNARTGKPTGPVLEHKDWVEDVCFMGDGKRVLSVGLHGVVRTWSVDTGEEVNPPLMHDSPLFEVASNPDGTRVLVGREGLAQLWTVSPPRSSSAAVEEVEAWVEFLTRRRMEANGTLSWLTATEWRKRQELHAAVDDVH
jgi:WD40 repeat protein/tRNA A-37 threonylcarbamoyl transferase component Bud32